MSLLFSAIGATLVALLDATIGQKLQIGNATPHFLLVLGVIWSIAAGIERGIAWAFVGGLTLDALLGRPLGVTAFALLIAVGGAVVIAQPMARLRLVAPIVAVPILSLVYSMLILVLGSTGQGAGTVADPLSLFLPGVVYDTVLAVLLGPLIVNAHDRQAAVERMDW
jgi:rod shape-determining protein MreD